jgi:hypothetical protein
MGRGMIKSILLAALALGLVASPAAAQRSNTLVPYLYCPADSPRYGYVAHRNIKWCYAGPRGSLWGKHPGYPKQMPRKK